MKIVGFVLSLNGAKTKCDNCGRTHRRSFVVEDNGINKRYGSGCIQKIGIPKRQLISALSSVTVQTSRLTYELLKDDIDK